MDRRALAAGVAIALAACRGSSGDHDGSAAGSARTKAPGDAARWQECTEAARAPMEVALLARYKLERTDERTDGLTCVTLQLPAGPAFFVELVGAHDDQRRRLHGIVAVDGTTELVPLRDAKLDWAQLRGGKVWFETVDLDGDGREDLVVHRGDARHATAEKIDVVAIREHALVELEGPKIAYDDSDLDEECRGTLAREKAGKAVHLVVDVTRSSGPTEHCMAAGRHVYELAGDRLLELGPSR